MDRARELSTLGEVFRAFARSSSGRVIAVFTIGAVSVRSMLVAPGRLDLVVTVAVLVAVGPIEWIIHRTLLHAPRGRWISELIGTRDSHERHHRDPDDLLWLLLRRPNAIGSCSAIVVPMALIAAAVGFATGDIGDARVWATASTAAVVALLALLHYEWVHLLVHSKYQPSSAYYRRLDRHHRLHHFRNEGHWLGVTSKTGDRLFGTLPADRSAVPLSPTARTLDETVTAGARHQR